MGDGAPFAGNEAAALAEHEAAALAEHEATALAEHEATALAEHEATQVSPSPEREADPFFKSWDDAAARLVRSAFLFGSGLLGMVFLPVLFKPVLVAISQPPSLSGFYQFAMPFCIVLIFLGGSVGTLLWGAVVLAGAINAVILAGAQDTPATTNPFGRWIFRLFSNERRFWSLALPALSLGITLTVLLISGVDASKELIQSVFRTIGVIP